MRNERHVFAPTLNAPTPSLYYPSDDTVALNVYIDDPAVFTIFI